MKQGEETTYLPQQSPKLMKSKSIRQKMKVIMRKFIKQKLLGLVLLILLIFWLKDSINSVKIRDGKTNDLSKGSELRLSASATKVGVNTSQKQEVTSLSKSKQEVALASMSRQEMTPWPKFQKVPKGENSTLDGSGINGWHNQPCDYLNTPWWQHGGIFHIPEDGNSYFLSVGRQECFKEGTDIANLLPNATQCPCRSNWVGTACSIPESVMFSNYPFERYPAWPLSAKNRHSPRKIINAFVFDMEFDFLDARLAEFGDIVDAFVILELNLTAHGQPKPLRLLERLKEGHYKEYSCKIVHVVLGKIPDGTYGIEDLSLDYLGTQGVLKQLSGYTDDDVVVLNEPDEIPRRDVMLYLKTHMGYPQPVSVQMTWAFFGYFWRHRQLLWVSDSIVTVGFLQKVFQGKAHHIRRIRKLASKNGTKEWGSLDGEDRGILERWNEYATTHGKVHHWIVGSVESKFNIFSTHSGWYCRYCFKPEDTVTAIATRKQGDSPKWREFPDHSNSSVVAEIVRIGAFPGQRRFTVPTNMSSENYAPRHFMENVERFKYLLENPYGSVNVFFQFGKK